jgi:hypothetical protein
MLLSQLLTRAPASHVVKCPKWIPGIDGASRERTLDSQSELLVRWLPRPDAPYRDVTIGSESFARKEAHWMGANDDGIRTLPSGPKEASQASTS